MKFTELVYVWLTLYIGSISFYPEPKKSITFRAVFQRNKRMYQQQTCDFIDIGPVTGNRKQ